MAVQSGERRHLICHPATPAKAVRAVWAEVALSFEDGFSPDTATDGLWQSSCFEAFLTEEGQPDYTEFNYAPDGRWACYQFDDYRSLLKSDDLAPWDMTCERGAALYILRIEPGIYPDRGSRLALSAVIEELDGTKSYWALRHPPGKPDFHHPDCFQLTLGAPGAA